jgi:hypothetical protein
MLTITLSTLDGNRAIGGDGGDGGNGGDALGGGLSFGRSSDTVSIDQSVIINNQATGGAAGSGGQDGSGIGGGVYIGTGTVGFTDAYIADNHASTSDDDVFPPG